MSENSDSEELRGGLELERKVGEEGRNGTELEAQSDLEAEAP